MKKPDAKWLKARTKVQGYTISALAEEFGLHHSAIVRAFQGKRELTFREACRMAKILNVSLGEFAKRMRY